jgi:soluble lytic murein transglycosylase-like protein
MRAKIANPLLFIVIGMGLGAFAAYGAVSHTIRHQERQLEQEQRLRRLEQADNDSLRAELRVWDRYVRPDSTVIFNYVYPSVRDTALADSLTRWFIVYGMQVGLSPRLLAATGRQESNFRRFARSGKGALGIMQIMPDIWWREFEDECGYWYRGDVQTNICYGAYILHYYYNKCDGDLPCALEMYNAGPSRRAGTYADEVRERLLGLGG